MGINFDDILAETEAEEEKESELIEEEPEAVKEMAKALTFTQHSYGDEDQNDAMEIIDKIREDD